MRKTVYAIAALLAAFCGSAFAAETARPNILFCIADELYDLRADRDCVHNLALDPANAERMVALRQRMETMLKAQADPRMEGRGEVFDNYKPTEGDGLYEKFMRGEKVKTGWVNPTDFEKQPIQP